MKPLYWVIAMGSGVGLVLGWQAWQQPAEVQPDVAPVAIASAPQAPSPAPASPMTAAPAAVAPAPDLVTRWIADADSTDASSRAAAIASLAQAPRDQALPVLRRLMLNAESAERPLALKSLRELALSQGDADSRIRQAIREVIYHGDDEQLAPAAQEALEAVEQSEQRVARAD
jgi:hypothetical protein